MGVDTTEPPTDPQYKDEIFDTGGGGEDLKNCRFRTPNVTCYQDCGGQCA